MKRIFRIALGAAYLAALAFSLVLLVKGGSAIFYMKIPLDAGTFSVRDNAYRVEYQINTHIYDPESVLVLENGKIFFRSVERFVLSGLKGSYVVTDSAPDEITVLFTPDEPGLNLRYSLYIRPYLLSNNSGGSYALVLTLGLVMFITTNLANPRKRKILLGSPFGFIYVWIDMFDPAEPSPAPPLPHQATSWIQVIVNTVLISYLYVLMEWIFLVTMPSFMDRYTLAHKSEIMVLTALVVALPVLALLLVIHVVNLMLGRHFRWFDIHGRHILAAFLAACLVLIMLDNFTYTVFRFGIVDSSSIWRLVYALVFCGFFYYFLRKLAAARFASVLKPLAAGIFGLSLIVAGLTYQTGNDKRSQTMAGDTASMPNIIFFGTDGLDSNHMSVYGYERDTTPFITELAQTSLLSQNNFTNAAHSMGSTTSLLNGKLSLITGVFFPPDTLKGSDKFEHLPGLLKAEGYRTIELGVPYYVDANLVDFQKAFDAVNCIENSEKPLAQVLNGIGFDDESYFFDQISGRIRDRLAHILFFADMRNPYTEVISGSAATETDTGRMGCLQTYLDEAQASQEPLFAHVHMMTTHGSSFSLSKQVFSSGQYQTSPWMTDFYDDAILAYDEQVEQLVAWLMENAQFENTILVLYTDHASRWTTIGQLPLLIHFPDDQYAGKLTANSQNLDIAPTILDYLGLAVPDWMGGSSLLEEVDPTRLILGAKTDNVAENTNLAQLTQNLWNPPDNPITEVTAIQCQNWYRFDLANQSMERGEFANYDTPCPDAELDSGETIRKKIGAMLVDWGYTLPAGW